VTLKVLLKIYVRSNDKIIGSRGLVKLLEAIEKNHSINKAAEELGITYRKAWSRIRAAEKRGKIKLITTARGKKGTTLTKEAKDIIKLYNKIHDDLVEALKKARLTRYTVVE